MSDLDGTTSSIAKQKLVVPKKNIVDSSKRDAQNYFKNLSSSVKKPTPPVKKEETVVVDVNNVVSI